MPLNVTQLAQQIEQAFNTAYESTGDSKAAQKVLATSIATAIDAYVRQGQVIGTCTTPMGGGTILGNVT